MKKITVAILLISAFISCKKENNNQNNSTGSTHGRIEYKINGQLQAYENLDALTQYALIYKRLSSVPQNNKYQINAFNGANTVMGSAIIIDSLRTGTYVIDSAASQLTYENNIRFNGIQSSIFFNGDNLTFNITSHSNGRVSGTFTGKLTPLNGTFNYADKSTTVITEGKIDNVQVIY